MPVKSAAETAHAMLSTGRRTKGVSTRAGVRRNTDARLASSRWRDLELVGIKCDSLAERERLSNFRYRLVVVALVRHSPRAANDGLDLCRSIAALFSAAAIQRQTHADCRSFTRRALDADRSAMQPDEA